MLQQAYGKNSMVEETMQSELSKNQIVQNESIGKSAGLFASLKMLVQVLQQYLNQLLR